MSNFDHKKLANWAILTTLEHPSSAFHALKLTGGVAWRMREMLRSFPKPGLPRSSSSITQEIIRASIASRLECADMFRRTRRELADAKAAARKAIAESRELMAEGDAINARR
jgi:hypothetical protein